MTKALTLTTEYELVYQMNLNLLEMARAGEWDGFVERAENYIITLQNVISAQPEKFREEDEEKVSLIIKKLIDNEAEISSCLQQRLDVLTADISTFNRGTKCNQAYSSNLTSPL